MKNVFASLLLIATLSHANYEASLDNKLEGHDEFVLDFEDEFSDEPIFDPLEGYNRFMTGFNDKFYLYVLNPVTDGYKFVTPQEFRDRLRDFFSNLMFPVRVTNNLLQGKFENAVEETGRFFVNTTFGLGGLFDAASNHGFKKHNEDFGQTLGHYGVGSGFHIVLPIVGSTNLRDLGGNVFDYFLSPLDYNNKSITIADSYETTLYLNVARTVNNYSYMVDSYELLKENAVDLYPFMRDIYEARRDKLIKE